MNIFALSYNPAECARFHNNKHCSKMILEHTQMLCTNLARLGVEVPYKPVHRNHPCTLWAGKTRNNFLWLCYLTFCLGEEFTYRYGGQHKSILVAEHCMKYWGYLPEGDLTPFALAMPDEFKRRCPIESYRNYYKGDKAHLADWGKRNVPEWFVM
jgi:hypothetical protein